MGLRAPKTWEHVTSAALYELLGVLEEEARLKWYWVDMKANDASRTPGYVDEDEHFAALVDEKEAGNREAGRPRPGR